MSISKLYPTVWLRYGALRRTPGIAEQCMRALWHKTIQSAYCRKITSGTFDVNTPSTVTAKLNTCRKCQTLSQFYKVPNNQNLRKNVVQQVTVRTCHNFPPLQRKRASEWGNFTSHEGTSYAGNCGRTSCSKHMVRRCSSLNQFLDRAASSALYIGHTAGSSSPIKLDLDLDRRFGDVDTLIRNIQARKMTLDINSLHSSYMEMVEIKAKIDALESQRQEISEQIRQIVVEKIPEDAHERSQRKEELTKTGRALRTQLKSVRDDYNQVEDTVVLGSLKLPVDLHHSTPTENEVIEIYGEPKQFSIPSESHLQIAQRSQTLLFNRQEPGGYYLLGELAKAQIQLESTAKELLDAGGFLQFSCPDMVKKLIVEGCGKQYEDPTKVFMVHRHGCDLQKEFIDSPSNQLYLTGVSPEGFISYVTTMDVSRRSLPLRFYSTGSQYKPKPNNEQLSLVNVPQANVVELFGAAETSEQMEQLYHEYIRVTCEFYRNYDIHFRVVNMSAENLDRMESSRTEIQVWIPSAKCFIQVGKVAMWSDFASRRLMMYNSSNKMPLYTVHSTVVRIPTLLAALIENKQTVLCL